MHTRARSKFCTKPDLPPKPLNLCLCAFVGIYVGPRSYYLRSFSLFEQQLRNTWWTLETASGTRTCPWCTSMVVSVCASLDGLSGVFRARSVHILVPKSPFGKCFPRRTTSKARPPRLHQETKKPGPKHQHDRKGRSQEQPKTGKRSSKPRAGGRLVLVLSAGLEIAPFPCEWRPAEGPRGIVTNHYVHHIILQAVRLRGVWSARTESPESEGTRGEECSLGTLVAGSRQRELQLLSGELLVHRALRKLSVAVLTLIMGYC